MLNPSIFSNNSLSLKCSSEDNKHWPFGHGSYQLGGNVGGGMPTFKDAKQNGFDDVLWLLDDNAIELTAGNIFFVIKDRFGTS